MRTFKVETTPTLMNDHLEQKPQNVDCALTITVPKNAEPNKHLVTDPDGRRDWVDNNAGGGIKTVIIKEINYDNILAGVAAASMEAYCYRCVNMTYEEVREYAMSGQPLSVIVMSYDGASGVPTIGPGAIAIAPSCLTIGVITSSGNINNVYWYENSDIIE